jgi:hypothetical protein
MKKLLASIVRFLSLGMIFPIPAGLQADSLGAWGLFGLMSNVNAAMPGKNAVTTAGTNTTLTAAQAVGGIVVLGAGATGGFTLTLPSTAAIISALGPTVPTDGSYSELFYVKNDGVGQTATLTAGDASTTVTGNATVATNTMRMFALTVTGPTTVTYENLGTQNL